VLANWENAEQTAKTNKEFFDVGIQRKYKALFKGQKDNKEVEEMGVVGDLTVNGQLMGQVVENEALRIAPGTYKGVLRYGSTKDFVQGPLGKMAQNGDFLLEVAGVAGREALLLHTGNKPWHSKGCVLAAAAKKSQVNGKTVVSISEGSTLRNLRKAFYGSDGTPAVCSNKTIRISIAD